MASFLWYGIWRGCHDSRVADFRVTDLQVSGHGFVGAYVTEMWRRRSRILDVEVAGCGVTDLWCRCRFWALR